MFLNLKTKKNNDIEPSAPPYYGEKLLIVE